MTARDEIQTRVELRAAGRCEYCRMHQTLQGATFHVEHVVPRSRGGHTVMDNLAWARPGCNLRKSDRVEVPDPRTAELVALFNPRFDRWRDHFRWEGRFAIPLTSLGRATASALDFNNPRRIRIREAEELFGLFPPDEVAPAEHS